MARIKNKVHRYDDAEYLKFLASELDFIGRPYRLDLSARTLTVFALPPPKPKKNKKKDKKDARNKRAESAGRKTH